MRGGLIAIAWVAMLFGCSAMRADQAQKLDDRLHIRNVAKGLIGDCPNSQGNDPPTECEIFVTVLTGDGSNQYGEGNCDAWIPVTEIHLHSTPNKRQTVRWRILNSNEFGFTADGITITPNKDNSGNRDAFVENKFTDVNKDDQYEWKSNGYQSDHPGGDTTKHNGYVAHVYRKGGQNPKCGTKDPLIANL